MIEPRLLHAILQAFEQALLTAMTAAPLDSLAARPRFADSEPEQDRWLTAQEASRLTGLSAKWFYSHGSDLPFAVRPSPRRLRFHQGQLMAWMRERQHEGRDG